MCSLVPSSDGTSPTWCGLQIQLVVLRVRHAELTFHNNPFFHSSQLGPGISRERGDFWKGYGCPIVIFDPVQLSTTYDFSANLSTAFRNRRTQLVAVVANQNLQQSRGFFGTCGQWPFFLLFSACWLVEPGTMELSRGNVDLSCQRGTTASDICPSMNLNFARNLTKFSMTPALPTLCGSVLARRWWSCFHLNGLSLFLRFLKFLRFIILSCHSCGVFVSSRLKDRLKDL